MTEHTPGPWCVTGDNIRSDNHLAGPGALLFIAGPMFHDYEPDPAEIKANLTLAASAPDLLAALEFLTAVIHQERWADVETGLEDARIAIAKARAKEGLNNDH